MMPVSPTSPISPQPSSDGFKSPFEGAMRTSPDFLSDVIELKFSKDTPFLHESDTPYKITLLKDYKCPLSKAKISRLMERYFAQEGTKNALYLAVVTDEEAET